MLDQRMPDQCRDDQMSAHLGALLPDHLSLPSSEETARKATAMKQVSTVIKPFRLDKIREALTSMGIQGMTVTEVKEFCRRRGYTLSRAPQIKIEVVVPEQMVERIIDVLRNAARGAHVGGGAILIIPVTRAIRIRTGETDADAL
jgi:nitrogen regulatory protein P-II 2